MITAYILSGLLLFLSLLNLIIYRKKNNLIKFIVGCLFSLLIFVFIYINEFAKYLMYYEITLCIIIGIYLLLFIPKRITKNLTEYDYFELEKNYDELREDRELLRERFLSTITLIDEGIVFYEDNLSTVILSDYSKEVFNGKPNRTFKEHLEGIYHEDKDSYKESINRAINRTNSFEVKYRLEKDPKTWIIEKGAVIKNKNTESIISTIRPININQFKKSTYVDIDSLKTEGEMYSKIKEYLDLEKPFVLIQFELSNIPEINNKHSREIGSLMMSEYIRLLKKHYNFGLDKLYRLTGIRFVGIIDDLRTYEDFIDDLKKEGSLIYNSKINISEIKECIIPNYSVINVKSSTKTTNIELIRLSTKLLEEIKIKKNKNYTII